MYLYFEKLFDKEKCAYLCSVLRSWYEANKLHHEIDMPTYYANSYGVGAIPEFEKELYELTPFIKEKTGIENIAEENSFARIYFNGGALKRHIDRDGLDLTLSVCLFSNIEKPWPLYVEVEPDVVKEFETPVGDGALILGTKMFHWRDDLICTDKQAVIQVFFHWRIKDAN
jgi:hypothetical protein